MTLYIIHASVRQGRKGFGISEWMTHSATDYNDFKVKLIDLREVNLPMMDEPNHPVLKLYIHQHTLEWSKLIEQADAFIFVSAEYDFGYPGVLRNAIEYLYHEWNYKPAGIVSYGGVSGGTRAFNALRNDLSAVKMFPLMTAVHIPFFSKQLDSNDRFIPNDQNTEAAKKLFNDLIFYHNNVKSFRDKNINK